MEDVIRGIMVKGIKNLAKKNDLPPEDCQICIRYNEEGELTYNLLYDYRMADKDVPFKQILGVKIDLLGREMLVAPFIQSILKTQAESLETERHKVSGIVIPNGPKDVRICIYHNGTFVKNLNLDEILA